MVKVREAELVEVREIELAEVSMEVEIEPIRVNTKLDIIETEAELGTKSRIHNLAYSHGSSLRNISA